MIKLAVAAKIATLLDIFDQNSDFLNYVLGSRKEANCNCVFIIEQLSSIDYRRRAKIWKWLLTEKEKIRQFVGCCGRADATWDSIFYRVGANCQKIIIGFFFKNFFFSIFRT